MIHFWSKSLGTHLFTTNLSNIYYRIFIDRLIVDRPHPWGIMYAFIELIKEKDVFRKKAFFKNTEFEEMIKHVFKVMGKGDGSEN